MPPLLQVDELLTRSRRLRWVLVAFSLLTLLLAVGLTTLQVRQAIREQIVRRDGAMLHAVALSQLEDGGGEPGTDAPDLFTVMLVTSRLRGVLAARLLDADGRFVEGFPVAVRERNLAGPDLAELRALRPVCHLHDALRLAEVFYPETDRPVRPEAVLPVLEVNIPLHQAREATLLGVGQLLIEGHSVQAEFRRLDSHLLYQSLAAFLVTGGLLTGAMAWAFRRLRQTHQQLAARTSELVRANQELALAAKTTAVGAVASHLIHGLKSPLAGLHQFVSTAGRPGSSEEADREQAIASTRRMQQMIHDVVSVLREQEHGARYQVTLEEVTDLAAERVRAAADGRPARILREVRGDTQLDNRTASLVTFILVNLLENAIEVTPPNGTVCLDAETASGYVRFRVRDHGPGFPPGARSDPFQPRPSAKEAGSGIGLAISRQLATHLGATLELRETSPAGCLFELELPPAAGNVVAG